MKRFLAFVLLLIFISSIGINICAINSTNNSAEKYEITPADLSVDAESAVLMEASSGKILFEKNADSSKEPASVTKIMTLLLTMEALGEGKITLEDKVCVSANAASMGGSQVFLKEGEEMTVRDLIKCTVIASANDAAVALAEHICGSEDSFVRAMNSKAEELSMSATNFENTTGLDDTAENHVTSARDIAIMSRELIKYPLVLEYSSLWQDSIRDGEFTLTNTNRLVRYYDGCNGLKTGSTAKAGYCMSATAERNGMTLIAVVMGAKTRDERNTIARTILDFGFANYALYSAEEKELENIPVYSGEIDSAEVYSKAVDAVVDKNMLNKVRAVYDIPDYIKAPISCGDVIGNIRYEIDGKLLCVSEVFVKNDISEISLFGIFGRILKTIVTGDSKIEKNDE